MQYTWVITRHQQPIIKYPKITKDLKAPQTSVTIPHHSSPLYLIDLVPPGQASCAMTAQPHNLLLDPSCWLGP